MLIVTAQTQCLQAAHSIFADQKHKDRLLAVDSLDEGTSRRLVLAERSDRRPGRSATRPNGPMYRGAASCKTLYARRLCIEYAPGTRIANED